MSYWCESCCEEIERINYCFDSERDELYLFCPFCGGECEEIGKYGEYGGGSARER